VLCELGCFDAKDAIGSGGTVVYAGPEWHPFYRNIIGSPQVGPQPGPGPLGPPFGVGSLSLLVGDYSAEPGDEEKAVWGNERDFIGDPVAGLEEVGFQVYNTEENIDRGQEEEPPRPNMPNIAFEIDPEGAGGTTTNFSTLLFSPGSNSLPNVWSQYIDATTTGVWGLTGAQFNEPATQENCGFNGPQCTFAEVQAFLASGEGAKIGTVAVQKGSDLAWQGAVDGLRINDAIYDFEPFGTKVVPAP